MRSLHPVATGDPESTCQAASAATVKVTLNGNVNMTTVAIAAKGASRRPGLAWERAMSPDLDDGLPGLASPDRVGRNNRVTPTCSR